MHKMVVSSGMLWSRQFILENWETSIGKISLSKSQFATEPDIRTQHTDMTAKEHSQIRTTTYYLLLLHMYVADIVLAPSKPVCFWVCKMWVACMYIFYVPCCIRKRWSPGCRRSRDFKTSRHVLCVSPPLQAPPCFLPGCLLVLGKSCALICILEIGQGWTNQSEARTGSPPPFREHPSTLHTFRAAAGTNEQGSLSMYICMFSINPGNNCVLD
jgi:hypothetical protein